MNDMKNTSIGKLRFELVTELLQGLEGEKPIGEMLVSADKLFVKDISDKVIIQARQRLMTLKQRYTQGEMKDDDVKTEISGILLMLT